MSITNLTSTQLRQAATIKDEIQALQSELSKLLGAGETKDTSVKPARRKLSAAARARIVAAQKARWAKIKAAKKK